jgi:hypothetical protein
MAGRPVIGEIRVPEIVRGDGRRSYTIVRPEGEVCGLAPGRGDGARHEITLALMGCDEAGRMMPRHAVVDARCSDSGTPRPDGHATQRATPRLARTGPCAPACGWPGPVSAAVHFWRRHCSNS